MSGLVLKLGPHERVLINGAVVENGDKRSRLAINAMTTRPRDSLSRKTTLATSAANIETTAL